MRRALALLVFLGPLLCAQSTPVTLPLQPIAPTVNLVSARSAGPPATVTTVPGSVTFTIGSASGTLSIQLPPTITGALNTTQYDLKPPAAAGLSISMNSLRTIQAGFFDYGSCLVFGGPGYMNQNPSDSCTLEQIKYETTDAGEPGVRIYTVVSVSFGNSNLEYDVNFRWAIATASPTTNSITLDTAVPSNNDPLPEFATYLPAFCGFGTYTYRGPNTAHIILELTDQKGNFLARSGISPDTGKAIVKTIELPSGSKLGWGGGCTDPKQFIFIADKFIMPRIDYPAGTPYDQVVASFNLQASLYDSVTSQRLATSTPVVYNVAPGVSATSQLVLHSASGQSPDVMVDPSVPIEPSPNLGSFFATFNGAQLQNGRL